MSSFCLHRNEPAEKERPYYYRNHPTGQTRNNHLKHKNNNYPMKTRVLTHGHPPSRPWTRVYGPPMPYYPAGYGQGYLSNQVPQWSRRRYNGRNMHQPQEYHPHQDHERWNRTLPQQGVIPTPRYQGHGRPGVFSTQLLGLGPVDRETQAKRRIYLASIAKAMAGTSLRSQEVMSQPKSLVPGNTKPLYPYPHKRKIDTYIQYSSYVIISSAKIRASTISYVFPHTLGLYIEIRFFFLILKFHKKYATLYYICLGYFKPYDGTL